MPTKLEARVDKHDREIAAIRRLVLTGMRILVQIEKSQKETGRMLKELKASQTETDRMLKDLIRSLGRRGNGNGHKNTDIQ